MPPQSFIMEVVLYETYEANEMLNTRAKVGEPVTFTNENTGESKTVSSGDSGVTIFDLANFPSGWTNGDIVSYTVSGAGNKGKYVIARAAANQTTQLKFLKVKLEES